jgi:hypothetical protein
MKEINIYSENRNFKFKVHAFSTSTMDPLIKRVKRASKKGNLDVVVSLVESDARLADLAFETAARTGHENIVKKFIDCCEDRDGPFLDSVSQGHVGIAKILWEKGVAVSLNEALICTVHFEQWDMAQFLINEGANNWEEALEEARESNSEKFVALFSEKLR